MRRPVSAARVGRPDAVGLRPAAGRDRGPHDGRHALGLRAQPRVGAPRHERRERGQLAARRRAAPACRRSSPSIASTRTRSPVGTTAKSGAPAGCGPRTSRGATPSTTREERGGARRAAAARGGARGSREAGAARRRPPTARPPRRATRSGRARGSGSRPTASPSACADDAARRRGASATRAPDRATPSVAIARPTWRARLGPGCAAARVAAQPASRPARERAERR